jgi:hypothetical protein
MMAAPPFAIVLSLGNADVSAGRTWTHQNSLAKHKMYRSLDVRADIKSTHNTNSVDPEALSSGLSPINLSSNLKAHGDHITRDEVEKCNKRLLATRASSLSMLDANVDTWPNEVTIIAGDLRRDAVEINSIDELVANKSITEVILMTTFLFFCLFVCLFVCLSYWMVAFN